MIQIEKLKTLRDALMDLPNSRLTMAAFCTKDHAYGIELFDDCNTAGCLAGWTCAIFAPECPISPARAAKILGLDSQQAFELFNPAHKPWDGITKTEMVEVLTNIINTGEVTWPTEFLALARS